MRQDNILKANTAIVTNKDKQFFEMGLETDTTIKSLVTLTFYNWQLIDITNSLTFLATSTYEIVLGMSMTMTSFLLFIVSLYKAIWIQII